MQEQSDERPRYLPIRRMRAQLSEAGRPVGEVALEVQEVPFGSYQVPVARGRIQVGKQRTRELLGRIRARFPGRVSAYPPGAEGDAANPGGGAEGGQREGTLAAGF